MFPPKYEVHKHFTTIGETSFNFYIYISTIQTSSFMSCRFRLEGGLVVNVATHELACNKQRRNFEKQFNKAWNTFLHPNFMSSKCGMSCAVHCDEVLWFWGFQNEWDYKFFIFVWVVKLCDLEFKSFQFGDILWFEGFIARYGLVCVKICHLEVL